MRIGIVDVSSFLKIGRHRTILTIQNVKVYISTHRFFCFWVGVIFTPNLKKLNFTGFHSRKNDPRRQDEAVC